MSLKPYVRPSIYSLLLIIFTKEASGSSKQYPCKCYAFWLTSPAADGTELLSETINTTQGTIETMPALDLQTHTVMADFSSNHYYNNNQQDDPENHQQQTCLRRTLMPINHLLIYKQ